MNTGVSASKGAGTFAFEGGPGRGAGEAALTATPLARIRSRFREAVIWGRRAGMDSQQVQMGHAAGARAAPRGGGSGWLDAVRRRRASAYVAGPDLDDA